MAFFQQFENFFHVFLFIEDQVCKFLLPVDKDKPVVVIGRAVVRVALAYPAEGTFDVIIGNVIFDAQIPVEKEQLAKTDAADLCCLIVVGDVRLLMNPLFVGSFEF